jgi:hypothetical protein
MGARVDFPICIKLIVGAGIGNRRSVVFVGPDQIGQSPPPTKRIVEEPIFKSSSERPGGSRLEEELQRRPEQTHNRKVGRISRKPRQPLPSASHSQVPKQFALVEFARLPHRAPGGALRFPHADKANRWRGDRRTDEHSEFPARINLNVPFGSSLVLLVEVPFFVRCRIDVPLIVESTYVVLVPAVSDPL